MAFWEGERGVQVRELGWPPFPRQAYENHYALRQGN